MSNNNKRKIKVLVSGETRNGLTEVLDEVILKDCSQCPYNHVGGYIIRNRRHRDGQNGDLSSSSVDLYFRCNFDEKKCSSLDNELRKGSSGESIPIYRSLIKNYTFQSKRKIINKNGFTKLKAKIERRIK